MQNLCLLCTLRVLCVLHLLFSLCVLRTLQVCLLMRVLSKVPRMLSLLRMHLQLALLAAGSIYTRRVCGTPCTSLGLPILWSCAHPAGETAYMAYHGIKQITITDIVLHVVKHQC